MAADVHPDGAVQITVVDALGLKAVGLPHSQDFLATGADALSIRLEALPSVGGEVEVELELRSGRNAPTQFGEDSVRVSWVLQLEHPRPRIEQLTIEPVEEPSSVWRVDDPAGDYARLDEAFAQQPKCDTGLRLNIGDGTLAQELRLGITYSVDDHYRGRGISVADVRVGTEWESGHPCSFAQRETAGLASLTVVCPTFAAENTQLMIAVEAPGAVGGTSILPIPVQETRAQTLQPKVIGIDYGTSNTCMALLGIEAEGRGNAGRERVANLSVEYAETVGTGPGMAEMPSVCAPEAVSAFVSDGVYNSSQVGLLAKSNPRAIRRAKVDLLNFWGEPSDTSREAVRLQAAVVAARATQSASHQAQLGHENLAVGIAMPSACIHLRRLRETYVAEIKGGIEHYNPGFFKKRRTIIVDESWAAYYGALMGDSEAQNQQLGRDARFMIVCDVGGGTTDCALFERTEQGPLPLALAGIAFGGEDISDMLSDYGSDIEGLNWEGAKLSLGDNSVETTLKQFGVSKSLKEVRLDLRERLVQKLSLAISALARFAQRYCSTAPGLDPTVLTSSAKAMVLVTGGSAKLSFGGQNGGLVEVVGQLVKTNFSAWDVETFSPRNPKECTALGVAQLAFYGHEINSMSSVLPFDLVTPNQFAEDVVLAEAGTYLGENRVHLDGAVGQIRNLYARSADGRKYLVREFDPPRHNGGDLGYDPESGEFA